MKKIKPNAAVVLVIVTVILSAVASVLMLIVLTYTTCIAGEEICCQAEFLQSEFLEKSKMTSIAQQYKKGEF